VFFIPPKTCISRPYSIFLDTKWLLGLIFEKLKKLGLNISLLGFLCFKQNIEKISPKNALAKYLANANFGLYEFFPEPKVALGKEPLYLHTDVLHYERC
jgi:hypothetical protein